MLVYPKGWLHLKNGKQIILWFNKHSAAAAANEK